MNIPTYTSGILQAKAHRILRAHVSKCLERYNLNPTYWSLLGTIMASPDGVRVGTVAKMLGIKAPLVTVMADELISLGFIDRITHYIDKRAKLLIMTASGKKMVAAVDAALAAELDKLLAGVTPEDLAAYKRVLTAIVENDTTTLEA